MSAAKKRVLQWFKENDPLVYNVAINRYKLKESGLGTTQKPTTNGLFQSLVETVQTVVPAVIGYRQQNKIMNMQVERARQGLPPLEASQYSPTMKIEAALSPEGEASAHRIAMDSVRAGIGKLQPIMFAGLALGAFLMFRKRR